MSDFIIIFVCIMLIFISLSLRVEPFDCNNGLCDLLVLFVCFKIMCTISSALDLFHFSMKIMF